MNLGYLGLVWKDISKRKFSSFLTLLAISLGILTIFVIFLLGQGFEDSVQAQFEKIGSNRLYLFDATSSLTSTSFTKGLTTNDLNLVANRPYVEKVYPYYTKVGQIKYGKEIKTIQIMGTPFDNNLFKDLGLEIEEGREPQSNERYIAILGSVAAKDSFEKEIPVGGNIYIKDTKFKVVGILKSVGNSQDDSAIYFDINSLRNVFGEKDAVGFADVVIVEGYDLELAKENLQLFLDNRLGKDSVNIIAPTQLLEQVGSILGIIQYTLGGIAFVALIVGAIGIVNTMYVVVTEKTRDIGIMKSIGATNEQILIIYIFEAGVFGFLGALLGVIFGSISALAFEKVAQASGFGFLEITILPQYVVALLIFGFLIGIFAGYLPAKTASKINIIDAIRN